MTWRVLQLTSEQTHLLRASLLRGEDAIGSYDSWIQCHSAEDLHTASTSLFPLLSRNLTVAGLQASRLRELDVIRQQVSEENRTLLRRAEDVFAYFRKKGIKAGLIGGAAILISAYDDPGLRPLPTLEVFVEANRAEAALMALGNIGFRARTSESVVMLRSGLSVELEDDHGVDLTLTTHVLARRPSAFLDRLLWGAAEEVERSGVNFRILNDADQMLGCAIEAADPESAFQLVAVADAYRLGARLSPAAWERLVTTAVDYQLTWPLSMLLGFLHEHLHLEVPVEVLESLNNAFTSPIEQVEFSVTPGIRRTVLNPFLHHRRYTWLKEDKDVRMKGFVKYLRLAWGIEKLERLQTNLLSKLRNGNGASPQANMVRTDIEVPRAAGAIQE